METEEMKSPFEEIKHTDSQGIEWWNSRILAKILGYSKYWNFERIVDKAIQSLQSEKGMSPEQLFIETEEMATLGNGTSRRVKSFMLTRAACLGIVCCADKRKPMVKAAAEYFHGTLDGKDLSKATEANMLIYRSAKGQVNVTVLYNNDTFWLSQKRMAELFGTAVSTINYHIKQIEESGEIQLSKAIRKFRILPDKWNEQSILLYNLDVVIAVGYRVNSYEATQFRIWATRVLKEFIVKGFALDDERLKGNTIFGQDYFDELLDRIREIRTSERRYYQKITDIYAECSYDYDKDSETTRLFYQMVQNMMHFAAAHQTAAEIVFDRADAAKPYMGLTTWRNAPDGRIRKSDVTIAKNYLSENEMRTLERLSTSFVDLAETKALNQQLMSTSDWKEYLEKFLQVSDHDILPDAGKVSRKQADEKALSEYAKYNKTQDKTLLSDFDKMLDKLK